MKTRYHDQTSLRLASVLVDSSEHPVETVNYLLETPLIRMPGNPGLFHCDREDSGS